MHPGAQFGGHQKVVLDWFVTLAALLDYGAIDSQAGPIKTFQLPGDDIGRGDRSNHAATQSHLAFSWAVLTSRRATRAALKEEEHTGGDTMNNCAIMQTLGEDTTTCGSGLPLLKELVPPYPSELLKESCTPSRPWQEIYVGSSADFPTLPSDSHPRMVRAGSQEHGFPVPHMYAPGTSLTYLGPV